LAIIASGAAVAHAAPNRRAARYLAEPQWVTMAAVVWQFLSNCRGAIQHSYADFQRGHNLAAKQI